MPILPKEPDCYPAELLDQSESFTSPWWMLYTKPRQEKVVMRHLHEHQVDFYSPLVAQRTRSPGGRVRVSHVPLFSTYLFVRGGNEARHQAVCSGAVKVASEVIQVEELVTDLRQIRGLIEMGVPLTIESRLEPGQRVRVRNGSFAGYEGTVLRRENETRLAVAVRFMDQGVSVKLEDCQLELI